MKQRTKELKPLLVPLSRHSARIVQITKLRMVALVFVTLLSVSASARDLYVNADAAMTLAGGHSWETALSSIQVALDLSKPGDSIHVAGGTYPEPLQVSTSVTLLGGYSADQPTSGFRGPGVRDPQVFRTIIDTRTEVGTGISVSAPASISGFVLRPSSRGQPHWDAGVRVLGQDVHISECEFENAGYGVLSITGRATIRRCRFSNCGTGVYAYAGGEGLWMEDSLVRGGGFGVQVVNQLDHGISILNCTIAGCAFDGVLVSSAITTVQNSIVVNCSRNGLNIPGENSVLMHNDVFGNSQGDYVGVESPTGQNGNISADPLLDPEGRLPEESPCVDAGATLRNAAVDLDGDPRPQGRDTDIGSDEVVVNLLQPRIIRLRLIPDEALTPGASDALLTAIVENQNPDDSLVISQFSWTFFDKKGNRIPGMSAALLGSNNAVLPAASWSKLAFSLSVPVGAVAGNATAHLVIRGFSQRTGGIVGAKSQSPLDLVIAPGCQADLCGDCNGDDQVNILDALFAARMSLGTVQWTEQFDFDSCNVAGERSPSPAAVIDILDALELARAQTGETSLSCCP